ncbi:MAG: ATP-binding protein, partial [Acidobacteria bacterium]
GARHAFKLLAALTALAATVDDEHPGLLLWEEPELCQNPTTLTRLLDVLFDMTKDKPIQICIATHSLEVIAHVTRLLQQNTLPHNDTLAFRMNLREGVLRSAWFDRDNLSVWLEAGHDPRVLEDFDLPLQFQLREDTYESSRNI